MINTIVKPKPHPEGIFLLKLVGYHLSVNKHYFVNTGNQGWIHSARIFILVFILIYILTKKGIFGRGGGLAKKIKAYM